MRNNGVNDARADQKAGVEGLGKRYEPGYNIEGHHKVPVSEDIESASDPRNIEFMDKEAHKELHRNAKKGY